MVLARRPGLGCLVLKPYQAITRVKLQPADSGHTVRRIELDLRSGNYQDVAGIVLLDLSPPAELKNRRERVSQR